MPYVLTDSSHTHTYTLRQVYKKDMVRTVSLGPFQHKVDDGAELRKLALACMDTLLDKCADMLGTPAFLQHVQDRLSDELDDIKQTAYQLLSKLALREPHCVREVSNYDRHVCVCACVCVCVMHAG
jgi:hypothetical protein